MLLIRKIIPVPIYLKPCVGGHNQGKGYFFYDRGPLDNVSWFKKIAIIDFCIQETLYFGEIDITGPL
jgi:hypothetical protein